MFLTIDPYYDIGFYNQCREALKNNGVSFKEYISIKAPFNWFFEVNQAPTFINYDVAPNPYERFLVSVVQPMRPSDEYLYVRRDANAGQKALNTNATNDALNECQVSGEAVFFTASREQALTISKLFPRKLYYLGHYFNRKYRIFVSDSLLVKNFVPDGQLLAFGSGFDHVTSIEAQVNYKTLANKDKILKFSQTPYLLNGNYVVGSVRADLTDKFLLS